MIKNDSQIDSVVVTHNTPDLLIKDISTLIDEATNPIAREYNSTQALLCWLIGKRIDDEILKSERAEYGETIVVTLANHLTLSYGKGSVGLTCQTDQICEIIS
jgi:hypothetical protein